MITLVDLFYSILFPMPYCHLRSMPSTFCYFAPPFDSSCLIKFLHVSSKRELLACDPFSLEDFFVFRQNWWDSVGDHCMQIWTYSFFQLTPNNPKKFFAYKIIPPKLRKSNLHKITHSLIICWNPREQMFVVQISRLIVTFLFLILQILSLMQTTKEVNPRPHIAPCVNMWSVTFLFNFSFLCHLLNVGAYCIHMPHCLGRPSGVDHIKGGERRMNSNFIVSHATLIL